MNNTIVIVDDLPSSLHFMKEILSMEGFSDILTYLNPITAYREMVRSGCPGLVITDYDMPQVNGVELLDQLSLVFPRLNAIIATSEPRIVSETGVHYPIVEKGTKQFWELVIESANRLGIKNSC